MSRIKKDENKKVVTRKTTITRENLFKNLITDNEVIHRKKELIPYITQEIWNEFFCNKDSNFAYKRKEVAYSRKEGKLIDVTNMEIPEMLKNLFIKEYDITYFFEINFETGTWEIKIIE